MKFLRLAFYVLIAQLVLSGCAGEGVEETSSSSASEINFDAYVGRNASTRSDITDIDFDRGFKVYAEEQRQSVADVNPAEMLAWYIRKYMKK